MSEHDHIDGIDNDAMKTYEAGKPERRSDETIGDRILCSHQSIDPCRESGHVGGI